MNELARRVAAATRSRSAGQMPLFAPRMRGYLRVRGLLRRLRAIGPGTW